MRELDFTLTAGPTEASATTLAGLGAPITYHYDPQFLRSTGRPSGGSVRSSRQRTTSAPPGRSRAWPRGCRPGSDPPWLHCLNLVSGVFGKGLRQKMLSAGAELSEIEVPYDDAIDPADVEEASLAIRRSRSCRLFTARHRPGR